MPLDRSVGSSANPKVSGAESVVEASVSHCALAARCADHVGAASCCAVEITRAADCLARLPAGAELTTRDGVTSITLVGGASKSFPTLQPMMSATAREASLPCCVRM